MANSPGICVPQLSCCVPDWNACKFYDYITSLLTKTSHSLHRWRRLAWDRWQVCITVPEFKLELENENPSECSIATSFGFPVHGTGQRHATKCMPMSSRPTELAEDSTRPASSQSVGCRVTCVWPHGATGIGSHEWTGNVLVSCPRKVRDENKKCHLRKEICSMFGIMLFMSGSIGNDDFFKFKTSWPVELHLAQN